MWMIPVNVRVFDEKGGSRELTTLLDGPAAELDIGTDAVAYKVNSGQTGFYRVKYDDRDNLEHLGRRVSEKTLSLEDRWGIQNDLFAFAKSGTIAVQDYLAFLSHYGEEDAFLPLAGIAGNLFQTYLVMEGDQAGEGRHPWAETSSRSYSQGSATSRTRKRITRPRCSGIRSSCRQSSTASRTWPTSPPGDSTL